MGLMLIVCLLFSPSYQNYAINTSFENNTMLLKKEVNNSISTVSGAFYGIKAALYGEAKSVQSKFTWAFKEVSRPVGGIQDKFIKYGKDVLIWFSVLVAAIISAYIIVNW